MKAIYTTSRSRTSAHQLFRSTLVAAYFQDNVTMLLVRRTMRTRTMRRTGTRNPSAQK